MIWGKIAACFILVPLQASGWLILLMVNGIAISGLIPIILHVSAASLALILIGALCALKYRERTNAQFIFSAAVVVVILLFLAFPMNTANIIVRLSIDSVGPENWLILLFMISAVALLSYIVTYYAKRVKQKFA
jgi:hypothetical protein